MKPLNRIMLFLTMALKGFSQNSSSEIIHDNMLWVGYYNTINFNDKWSLNSDSQFRTKNGVKNNSQALIRTGLSYKINNKIDITSGFAHFRFFITNERTRGEWRPWQEIKLTSNFGSVNLINRVRVEQRYIEGIIDSQPSNKYNFNFRFRYRLDMKIPINKEKEEGKNFYLLVGNEIMVNAGENINSNYFDQDRLFVGLNYELNKKITLQFQYMHIWQQLATGNTLMNLDVIRFNLYHTLTI